MTQSAGASVKALGWLCIATGGILVLASPMLILAGAMQRSLAEQGIDAFAASGVAMDPMSRVMLRHVGVVAGLLLSVGTATVVVGVQCLRLRPGARAALEVLSWLTLLGTVAGEAASLVAWSGTENPEARAGGVAAAGSVAMGILSLLQCVVCVMVIRFVRGTAVRELFARGASPEGPSGSQR